jgi:hypothetical protein
VFNDRARHYEEQDEKRAGTGHVEPGWTREREAPWTYQRRRHHRMIDLLVGSPGKMAE